jgi:signal peptidase I
MHLIRWLLSGTVRKAGELGDSVEKILNHQRDILPESSIAKIEAALGELKRAVRSGADSAAIKAQMAVLEETAGQWLKPYAGGDFREYAVMFFEIAVLILGSRQFLVQPMVIPTGSAQPTLWGITFKDLRDTPEVQIPALPKRIWERWIDGISYYHEVAKEDCDIIGLDPKPTTYIPFVAKQNIKTTAGDIAVWFPPDNFAMQLGLLDEATGYRSLRKSHFRKGEDIVKSRVVTGDHLFVERVTYNFRHPKRGEIIVFRSETHPGMTANTHYIKRLVGLGDERIRIGDDRHTYINGVALTTNDYGFDRVFGFDPKRPPEKDHYSGHVNGTIWRQTDGYSGPTANFPDAQTEYTIRPGHYVCFGDNTMNSSDSRAWGEPDFPQEKVIGRSLFVFWPFTKRVGLALK